MEYSNVTCPALFALERKLLGDPEPNAPFFDAGGLQRSNRAALAANAEISAYVWPP